MISLESPLQIQQPVSQNEVVGNGSEPFIHYYEWEFKFNDVIPNQELNEHEIIKLAENVGSFKFLDSVEEDIYNDVLKAKNE